MKLPALTVLETDRQIVDVFKGYNHNLRIGEGEFYDMKNLTSDTYPVLSPRGKRGTWATPASPQGMIAKDALCYVDGRDFVVNGYRVPMQLSVSKEDCPKQLVSMGAYVIILPDKKYINTADIADHGDIEASFTTTTSVRFEMCRVDGTQYTGVTVSSTEPTASDKKLWIDTSSTPHTLKQYSESSAMWVPIATTYVRITADGIGKHFSVNDGVSISGITVPQLSDLNNTMIIWDKGDDYIVVTGILDEVEEQGSAVTVKRTMPIMDFVIESDNRLWGCRYGVAENGEVVNEIYASKQGDFKNWKCFMGISTDSWTATVGSDGQFTGAITHGGYPLFFKENCMHRVYGKYPAQYQINTQACRGVQKGCHKSLAIVNEVLYYKSRNGICAYDGALPQEVSYALGDVRYSEAVACAHGNKYYVSMYDDSSVAKGWITPFVSLRMIYIPQIFGAVQDGDTLRIDGWEEPLKDEDTLTITQVAKAGQRSYRLSIDKDDGLETERWHLFVYDTAKGMWHREDHTRVDDFCSCGGELYYIDHYDRNIKTMLGSGEKDVRSVEWMAETGIIGTSTPDKQYVSKLNVKMNMDVGARAFFYIQYDSSDEWEYLFYLAGKNLQTFTIPIRPKRCDHFKLRIEGIGDTKIYSIAKTIDKGSDR